MAYIYAAEDLFASKIVRPDIEFVNAYTTEAWEVTRSPGITRDGTPTTAGSGRRDLKGEKPHERQIFHCPAQPGTVIRDCF